MRHVLLAAAVLLCTASMAPAQTKGIVSVGGSVTFDHTTDGAVGFVATVGPLVRLNPRRGWGPAGAFNWFEADIQDPSGAEDFAQLRVRPLMGGISYSIGNGDLLTSFSLVLGPSFNRARFHSGFPGRADAAIDADNSFALRPGVGLTWTVAPRVAVIGFGGYMINRPSVVYRDSAGNEFRDRWKADAVVLSVGAVYSLF